MAVNEPGETSHGAPLRAALVGHDIAASLTPAMQQAEARAQGLDFRYGRMDTGTPAYGDMALADILDRAQAQGMTGLNITHPHKVAVVRHLDQLSDDAARLGAVNTVLFRAGSRIGHNTDLSGFAASLGQFGRQFRRRLDGDRVLLLGAGGAGAAVAFALLRAGVGTLSIHDRDPDRVQALLDRLGRHFDTVRLIRSKDAGQLAMQRPDGVVNATPMGMARHPGSAYPLDLLRADMWVADIVYFPLETRLLARARDLGCQVMAGSGMAVFQAAHAYGLFTGQPANASRMAQTFQRLCAPPV
jgi:quinate/shikimate dehydrogenase (NAD+)